MPLLYPQCCLGKGKGGREPALFEQKGAACGSNE
jgi:hypothetical protein